MKILDIKLGYNCNNNCQFCEQGDKRFYEKDSTTEEIKKLLKKESKKYDGVFLTGGEVTIREDVFEIIKFAKQCNYNVAIQSNGRMFSSMEFCYKMVEAGADTFTLSLHGSTPQMHDQLTRVPGSFLQTLRGIFNLKKLDQKVFANTVITKINYKDLANTLKVTLGMGVDGSLLSFMHINNLKDEKLIEEIVPRYKEIVPYIQDVLCEKIFVKSFPYCVLEEKYHKHILEKILPLSFIYEIYEKKKIKDYQKIRKDFIKVKQDNCKMCKFYKTCYGPSSNYVNIFGFDEFVPIKKCL